MIRLTTDSPKDNFESALNLFYAKDGEAWVLGGGDTPDFKDVTLRDYIKKVSCTLLPHDTELLELDKAELDECLYEWLFYGSSHIRGIIAVLYAAGWAFAELRARLKMYEDQEDELGKGCEYCTDSKSVYHLSSELHDSMNEDVYISGNALVVDIGCRSYGSSTIKYCPMCGRKLPQTPSTDQE